MKPQDIIEDVITEGLNALTKESFPIYTIGFYYDHEGHALSICADTKENSMRQVKSQNEWTMKMFLSHLEEGDLESAEMFQVNSGRNLSLGDFSRVNLARQDLDKKVKANTKFFLSLTKAMMDREDQILRLSPTPDEILFCSSTEEEEVGLVWIKKPMPNK